MKFIALSDTHGQHRSKKLNAWLKENSADILLFAGDLQLNNFDLGLDFIDWLHELPYLYKVITFGNHDGNFEYSRDKAKMYEDVYVLNHESVTIKDVTIFGSPYSLPFLNWHFMKTEEELEYLYQKIPENTNILITHGCSFNTNDITENNVITGSRSLDKRIKQIKNLKYHISGHIHENGSKQAYIENVVSINASVLDERYRLVFKPTTFEI